MTIQTWHHGLVARWWAEFNQGGGDVEFFHDVIARNGEPVLDAGCGTGRILLPMLARGIDIDGSDAAPDMLQWCEEALASQALTTRLYCRPMHELTTDRTYQTILICGAFGLGGSRADDLEGLRRLKSLLRPGGLLVVDHYLPNFGKRNGDSWVTRPRLPQTWPQTEDRRQCADGTELSLNLRTVAFDPLEQTTTREIRVRQFDGAELLGEECYPIKINLYFKPELELMLRTAGFGEVTVTGGLQDRPAVAWQDARIVFTASA